MASHQRLVEMLGRQGSLPSQWRDIVAGIDRGLFCPEVIEGVSKAADPDTWAARVYDDLPVIVQWDDGRNSGQGVPTSSSSMPSIMLEMLVLLDVREGCKVGEVGSGTGLNAAWIARKAGAKNVATIELDAAIADQARANLKAAGVPVQVVTGDGLRGIPGFAPMDRLICTCTVRAVPYAWIRQVPQGRIVTPWGGSFHSYSFVTLDVADGVAQGEFSGNPAFMWARSHRGRASAIADVYHGEEGDKTTTTVDPRDIEASRDAEFAIGIHLRDASSQIHFANDGSEEATYWVLADDRKSWATVEYVPGQSEYEVDQYGPRRLWDEVEAAWRWWEDQGRPGRDRFGLTVDSAAGQRVWLDSADRVVQGCRGISDLTPHLANRDHSMASWPRI